MNSSLTFFRPLSVTALLARVIVVTALLTSMNASAAAPTLKSEAPRFGQEVVANGYARLPQQSIVHYTESYLDDPLNNVVRASYWSSNRDLIAFKKLVFSSSESIVPESYEFIDYRRAKGYRVSVNSGLAKVETIRVATDASERVTKVREVSIDSSTIIDAGFHRFILSNWERLQQGKTVKMNFLQVDRARIVPIKIKKTKCDTPNTVCYKISLNNFLLQKVVPKVYMKYDLATKRLLAYSGYGIITKLSGKGQAVDTRYEYL